VLEYKTTKLYPSSKREQFEAEHTLNDEPYMVLKVQTPQGWQCLDATQKYGTLGHLMNHASPAMATVRPFKPLLVHGKWSVGFLAIQDIEPGTMLTWMLSQWPMLAHAKSYQGKLVGHYKAAQ